MNNLQQYLQKKTKADKELPQRLRRLKVYFDIAFQISSLRKAKNLTQAQLAKQIGTTQPNIARWETPGYTRYSISRLIDISEALGKTLQIQFSSTQQHTTFTDDNSWDGEPPVQHLRAHFGQPRQDYMPIVCLDNTRGFEVNTYEVLSNA
jgi:transcriptional regulator with XRE-family HTH domain